MKNNLFCVGLCIMSAALGKIQVNLASALACTPFRLALGLITNPRTSAWKALQSEATVTGDEVLGRVYCDDSAWKAVRLWKCINACPVA